MNNNLFEFIVRVMSFFRLWFLFKDKIWIKILSKVGDRVGFEG